MYFFNIYMYKHVYISNIHIHIYVYIYTCICNLIYIMQPAATNNSSKYK